MALADYINSKPTIETDRLILRPMTVADVPALKEWMPDKSIYTYWGKGPGKTEKMPWKRIWNRKLICYDKILF